MTRKYYATDSITELSDLEAELVAASIDPLQIHVYGPDALQSTLDQTALHDISSFAKSDVFASGLRGFALGATAVAILLVLAYISGWHLTDAGWLPIVFFSIVLFGFFGWEGGLLGIQRPNRNLSRFKHVIEQGKLLFYVDASKEQSKVLDKIVKRQSRLNYLGEGNSLPEWFISSQTHCHRFIKALP